MTHSDPRARRRRVLILGGGFGGAYAARRLGQTLGKRQNVEVVLISRENYLLFTPMLHEVAARDLGQAARVRQEGACRYSMDAGPALLAAD
jgi:NADH dehydrogenase FAD-containing subunit